MDNCYHLIWTCTLQGQHGAVHAVFLAPHKGVAMISVYSTVSTHKTYKKVKQLGIHFTVASDKGNDCSKT